MSDIAVQVKEASWCYRSQAWSAALSTGEHWRGDVIWLATGCKLDVKQDPLLSEVMKEFPIQVVLLYYYYIYIRFLLHAYINVH